MRVLLPATLDEAVALLAEHPGAVPMAGGTDLLVHWPVNLEARGRTYVDLSGLDELRPHRWAEDALVLGGSTTYWDVIRDPRAWDEFPLLVDAGRQVGAIQIQSRGTWAGNIVNASPAADGVPALMAYAATVRLSSSEGEEEVPLEDFYLGYKQMRRRPDQLITAITLPRVTYDYQRFEKVGPRAAQAITKIGLAMTRRAVETAAGAGGSAGGSAGDGRWRIVANSVAPTVRRCRALEGVLDGGAPVRSPDDLLPAIREDVSPIDDIRSTAAYRERVMARLLYFDLKDVCASFS